MTDSDGASMKFRRKEVTTPGVAEGTSLFSSLSDKVTVWSKGGIQKKQHCRTEPSPVLRNYCRPGTISKWMEPCGWWAMSTSQATKQGSEDLIMDEYGQGFFTYLWSLIPERKTFQQPAKPSTPPKNGSTSSELKMSPARSAPGNSAKAPMNMGVGSESGPFDL